MNVTLTVKNKKYYIVLEKIVRGRKHIKRSNSYTFIKSFIQTLGNISFINVGFLNSELYFDDDVKVVLKNYPLYGNTELYQKVMDKRTKNTKVRNIYRKINREKIISLVLSGCMLTTAVFAISNQVKKNSNESTDETVEPTVEETFIDSIEPSNVVILGDKEFEYDIVEPVTLDHLEETIPISPVVYEIEDTLEKRIEKTNQVLDGSLECQHIPVAGKINAYAYNKLVKFINSEEGNYFIKYGVEFGVDPYLLIAICMGESSLDHESTLPGGKYYNGFAVGIAQHETPNNERDITAFNYTLGQEETVHLDMDSACDVEMNIKMCAMIIQSYMHKYDNNIYLALQAYNYGKETMDMLLRLYAKDTNRNVEDIIKDYTDLGWMTYVQDMHNNPSKYINWNYGKYGRANYIEGVLGYYVGTQSMNILKDGTICYTNLLTLEKHYESYENVDNFIR